MSSAVPAKQRIERALAACMTLSAGYLDGYGLLALGTYVSFMSGNTTMTGVKAGQGAVFAALIPAIAIACFVAGSAAGNLIKHWRLWRPTTVVLLLVSALVAGVAVLGASAEMKSCDIAVLSFAMGMVNPVLAKIGGESISLTFMTGTLSRIGGHLGLALVGAPAPGSEGAWDTHWHRARMDAELWASFLVGAALSGAAISANRSYALWPAVALMGLLAVAAALREASAEKAPPKATEKDSDKAPPSEASVGGARSSRDREAASV